MSKINTGGPAFPVTGLHRDEHNNGMYATEAESAAVIQTDKRTAAEKRLDGMLEARGAGEQGADGVAILRGIAVELIGQPAAVPQGWAMEAVEDGIRLTAPDGERWRFRETDGSDLFVFKFLRAMLNAAPSPANHIVDANKMVQPRHWVGLSEAERVAIEEDNSLDTIGALFDAVESALRAKNEVKS